MSQRTNSFAETGGFGEFLSLASGPSRPSIYRRIAAVGRAGYHLLERRAHRQVEDDASGRDRLQEPLFVDRVDFPALVDAHHLPIHDFLYVGVLAAQHDAV